MATVMIMAGGTGGHVMPALAVAQHLSCRNVSVSWMGTASGLEARLLENTGIPFDAIKIKSLRGSSLWRKIAMPLRLLSAMFGALLIIRQRRPKVILGMGGFVAGPGGLVATLLRLPLVLHEQNTVAGLTNKLLARHACRVLSGFPVVAGLSKYQWVGNPVREKISALTAPEIRLAERQGAIRLLILGGSQGARVFNEHLPEFLKGCVAIEVWHQCGNADKAVAIKGAYDALGIDSQVTPFIEDMSAAYEWCDIVICRSGAMTVAEICAAGAVAIFIPFPYAVDDHQTKNASYLVEKKAAYMIAQSELSSSYLEKILSQLSQQRALISSMANAARDLSKPQAVTEVANICLEAANA